MEPSKIPLEQDASAVDNERHDKKQVTVTLNGNPKQIDRGDYIVSHLKSVLGVDASQALDEVIGGEFKPLEDSQHITIKGGEVFVSHARHGGSS